LYSKLGTLEIKFNNSQLDLGRERMFLLQSQRKVLIKGWMYLNKSGCLKAADVTGQWRAV